MPFCQKGNKVKVCFFIWALVAHGAERVSSILANEWAAKEGWETTFLTMDKPDSKPFYPLAESIEVRPLNLLKPSQSPLSALANNLERIRTLRREIQRIRPDVLISFIDKENALMVMASRGLGIPVIISERTDPSRRSLGRFWEGIRNLTYPRADVIVFQSQAVLDWFPPKVRARGVVIPNPVPLPPLPPVAPPTAGQNLRMVALGRLSPVKGFDVLVAAFAAASARAPQWELEVWGEGSERKALEQMVRDLDMEQRIHFKGLTDRPFDVLCAADLFVMSSHAEGFPNALVEAMACGCPVISTRFGGAVNEIIQDGVNGRLVPPANPEALAEAMVQLMNDPEDRARLGKRALEVVERFSTERVVGMWEDAINRAIASQRPR
ncbi:glycosyltransferase family 4 protein [Geothrix sp. PMB-07]|uniref:glycosyltransferase family 4 protein n=1 Tax=Geothrix sp. PMB-07 TaxID=3068640 RepID=UPI002741F415|nr:glycosyltransferase family 4 protein [Geothrix sp. PMB-07]WLT30171.1 glycosyltransferase family 4 protein [Geothrix sp. PMB-07]